MTTSSPTSPTSTISSADLTASLDLVEIKPGMRYDRNTLKSLLPDTETILFFGKVYNLDARQLGALLHTVLNSDLTSALFAEGAEHSADLQDYLVDLGYQTHIEEGDIVLDPEVPHGEILPQVWEDLNVEIATSIKTVAEKLGDVVSHLPGKQGTMMFQHMRALNARRPVLGDFRPKIVHAHQGKNLVIMDVSGSMNASTVRRIVDDVVAMSYMADAAFAIVSNNAYYWEPGAYDVDSVLRKAEYGGTHYEQLAEILNQDWGTVITVADYDSSYGAKEHIRSNCMGSIDTVLDISLVHRPTFLAECVGQLAREVRPLLTGSSAHVLT